MKKQKTLKTKDSFSRLIDLQLKSLNLPELSHVEKAKLEHALAIDQLYYSSKLEGSALTKEMINEAIHGKKFSAT